MVSACVRVTPHRGRKVTQEIRTFATTTPELLALREWLTERRVTHVAMEKLGAEHVDNDCHQYEEAQQMRYHEPRVANFESH
jgi:hypothetical protein